MQIVKTAVRVLCGIAFVGVGILHFARLDFFLKIMPPYIPWHLAMVYISGACEIGLGLLLCYEPTAVLAGWGLIALLIAVFPANLHMAMHPELYPEVSPVFLGARLPLQGYFIALAFWFTRWSPRTHGSNSSAQ